MSRTFGLITAVQVAGNVLQWLMVSAVSVWMGKHLPLAETTVPGWFFFCALHSAFTVAWVVWYWHAENKGTAPAWPLLLLAAANVVLMVLETIIMPFETCLHFDTIGVS